MSLFNTLQGIIWTVLASGGAALLATYVLQNKLVYVPYAPAGARTHFLRPEDFQLTSYEKLFFTTADGEDLQGWLFTVKEDHEKRPTFLYFHGNAGNISFRLPNIREIIYQLRCNVFIVSYRGFGLSTGSPSELGLKLDSEAALKYLLSREDIHPKKIVAFGRSLGGAVAIDLAATFPEHVRALVVENTFTSILDMVDVLFPVLSFFKPLCLNPWKSSDTIKTLKQPVLFLSGALDELIPPRMMEELHAICQSKVKEWKSFPDGQHMDTYTHRGYYPTVQKFVSHYVDDMEKCWQ
eukprot:TRINITY_DN2396_c0_g1_i1.p1 TRINITY_DN2396_c0_g1~~TRINITY_DN2396_c0_g1_i1.p1  ORF type:complete len:295 (+),score=33.28 TRINITY_DN2396_c0_g1_i1:3-887(+)